MAPGLKVTSLAACFFTQHVGGVLSSSTWIDLSRNCLCLTKPQVSSKVLKVMSVALNMHIYVSSASNLCVVRLVEVRDANHPRSRKYSEIANWQTLVSPYLLLPPSWPHLPGYRNKTVHAAFACIVLVPSQFPPDS